MQYKGTRGALHRRHNNIGARTSENVKFKQFTVMRSGAAEVRA